MTTKKISYQRHRFPSEIISYAMRLYHHFCLSFREVEELLAEHGIMVTYESIRRWCLKFGPAYVRRLKKRQGRLGDDWYLDEVVITIHGEHQYLWRAVDQDRDTIDILVEKRRNKKVAVRFFCRLLKDEGGEPRRLYTDKLKSYDAAYVEVMPDVEHINRVYANNRVEVSHQPTRQQEYHMRGFASVQQATTISRTSWTHTKSLPPWPPPHAGGELSAVAYAVVPDVEGIGVYVNGEVEFVPLCLQEVNDKTLARGRGGSRLTGL